MNEAEQFIISRLKSGDNDAYKYVFEHHYPYLCHVAAQYLHDDFMAEATVGDVIFHLWQARAQLDVRSSLRGYLLRAVRNRCLDQLKYRHDSVEIGEFADSDEAVPASALGAEGNSPLGILIEKELELEISRAVDSLPEECRRVFIKSRFERKKYREIAQELGLSMNTVKYHMKNALDFMEQRLGKYLPCCPSCCSEI